ncbi:MAG TPA: hypothetical protein PLP62_01710 [Flavobacteriaceae bacterium]|nr:hypothetical protein [Flavobacteriaceae bacterium]MCB9213183.1 hypothetical protein [Alteromonas sp.]HPF10145.1 hypothetical protein [Flavobacteriaceae bacterium]HQU65782.1 hypothetical protein [Flavobacteriaceae bacterium]HRW43813.1 hypothetical protein [Flavobacteriaceae bacterium]
MVIEQLSDFTDQKDVIVSSLARKQANGLFDQGLHEIFNHRSNGKDKLRIEDVQFIIESIELKLREAEIIYHTYFGTEYDNSIIVHNSLTGNKLIEAEFNYGTRVIKKRIEIIDPGMYKESINMNFQLFVLSIASLYENLVRLIETLIKKRVVFGEKNPHLSVHLKILIPYWDNLVQLGYRTNDEFYVWLNNYRQYFNKYLGTINRLRNSFIHGYSINLKVEHGTYVVSNFEEIPPGSTSIFGFQMPAGGGLIPELEVNNFVKDVLNESFQLTEELMNLLKRKISHHRTKVPI